MVPTIKVGEKITVDYTAYLVAAPKRWDVVVFRPPIGPKQAFVMRIIALPGETVSFASGGIKVNGQSLVLPAHLTNVVYVSLDDPALLGNRSRIPSPYVVPNRCYFVLGDCSRISNDSRFWGAVARDKIAGKVRGK